MANKFSVASHLKGFKLEEGGHLSRRKTRIEQIKINDKRYPKFTNEFWTSRQRQASSLHEISYRACFKPQLPRFFIELMTEEGDTVYDPFAGRGTTTVEAALLGRTVISNDINPLSRILTMPRLRIPNLQELEERLNSIHIRKCDSSMSLSMFYHPKTLQEILSLREYLRRRKKDRKEDNLDSWIRMVATNRLTGHSPGFFSVYTLPPNQAVSPEAQRKINASRKQRPEYRDTRSIVLKKSRQLVSDLAGDQIQNLLQAAKSAKFLSYDARHTPKIASNSVQLTVTSPPFLDVVQYAQDNWLRCWFNGIDAEQIASRITTARTIEAWAEVMRDAFAELFRITRHGGWVAFEVGEVRSGQINLDHYVVPLGLEVGFRCTGILINKQAFTKTANIWGIHNNRKGTNTNRVVMFLKK